MANTDSRVTVHMAVSLDGFIARKDGRVDWLETQGLRIKMASQRGLGGGWSRTTGMTYGDTKHRP
jgi:hypothetical protein